MVAHLSHPLVPKETNRVLVSTILSRFDEGMEVLRAPSFPLYKG